MQNHIWHVERRYQDAIYSAVIVAASKKDALVWTGMPDFGGYRVRCIGTASKEIEVGVIVADVHAADEEEYGLPNDRISRTESSVDE